MAKPFESFEERILSLDAETLAAIDAELEAERNDHDARPREVEWLGDPDPFGLDWQWAEPSDQGAKSAPKTTPTTAKSPAVIPFSNHPERWSPLQRVAYAAGAAIAASLLVGIGMLVGSRTFRGMEVLVAVVTPQFVSARGTGTDLRVEAQSDRPGFATVISLAPDRRQEVFPLPGADAVRVEPSGTVAYGPLPPDSRTVLAVLTERPATELVRDALVGKPFTSSQVGQLQDYLRKTLAEAGHRWAAFGITRFERSPKG